MIRQYLVDNYVYDLHPDTRPREADFVDHFLFEAKSGYCMHYASAMAILCRCIGIPTRFVTGFVPGELDIETDTYEVQAKDAHSWVEAYIEGRGWQSFDPTPPQDEDDDKGFFAAQWAKLTKMLPGLFEPGGGLERAGRWALWALGLIALVAAAAAGGKHWRLYYRLRLDPRRATPEERVRFVYGQLLHWTEHFGLPRRESEPPLEFLDRLRRRCLSPSPGSPALSCAPGTVNRRCPPSWRRPPRRTWPGCTGRSSASAPCQRSVRNVGSASGIRPASLSRVRPHAPLPTPSTPTQPRVML